MRIAIDVTLDYTIDGAADVLLLVEAAKSGDQRLDMQDLRVYCDAPLRAVPGEDGIGQRCWGHGNGAWHAEYRALVEVTRTGVDLSDLPATPMRALDGHLIPYLLPSRYCQSDRFEGFVRRQFAGLEGGALAVAMTDWVADSLDYGWTMSSATTTALDTFASRSGVCRDYAHLLVTLARAGGIPARCVSAYAPRVEPPDFHAVAELWLAGAWHLVDATRMAGCDEIARVCVGRDASDIAFMTVFGITEMRRQSVRVRTV